MNLHDTLRNTKFSSRPSIYFSPFEVDKNRALSLNYLLEFQEGEILTKTVSKRKKKKTYYECVVMVLDDPRQGMQACTNQASPVHHYLYDVDEEGMGKLLSLLNEGVDLIGTPIKVVTSRFRKGSRLLTRIDYQLPKDGEYDLEKLTAVPNLPRPRPLAPPETPAAISPPVVPTVMNPATPAPPTSSLGCWDGEDFYRAAQQAAAEKRAREEEMSRYADDRRPFRS